MIEINLMDVKKWHHLNRQERFIEIAKKFLQSPEMYTGGSIRLILKDLAYAKSLEFIDITISPCKKGTTEYAGLNLEISCDWVDEIVLTQFALGILKEIQNQFDKIVLHPSILHHPEYIFRYCFSEDFQDAVNMEISVKPVYHKNLEVYLHHLKISYYTTV